MHYNIHFLFVCLFLGYVSMWAHWSTLTSVMVPPSHLWPSVSHRRHLGALASLETLSVKARLRSRAWSRAPPWAQPLWSSHVPSRSLFGNVAVVEPQTSGEAVWVGTVLPKWYSAFLPRLTGMQSHLTTQGCLSRRVPVGYAYVHLSGLKISWWQLIVLASYCKHFPLSVCIHICGGQPCLFFGYHPPFSFLSFIYLFLKQGLSWLLELIKQARLVDQQALVVSSSSTLGLLTSISHYTLLLSGP